MGDCFSRIQLESQWKLHKESPILPKKMKKRLLKRSFPIKILPLSIVRRGTNHQHPPLSWNVCFPNNFIKQKQQNTSFPRSSPQSSNLIPFLSLRSSAASDIDRLGFVRAIVKAFIKGDLWRLVAGSEKCLKSSRWLKTCRENNDFVFFLPVSFVVWFLNEHHY